MENGFPFPSKTPQKTKPTGKIYVRHLYWILDFLPSKLVPNDDDVIRHIIKLREKLGWQTVLPQHNLEYRCFKTATQKILLKVLLYFVQFLV